MMIFMYGTNVWCGCLSCIDKYIFWFLLSCKTTSMLLCLCGISFTIHSPHSRLIISMHHPQSSSIYTDAPIMSIGLLQVHAPHSVILSVLVHRCSCTHYYDSHSWGKLHFPCVVTSFWRILSLLSEHVIVLLWHPLFKSPHSELYQCMSPVIPPLYSYHCMHHPQYPSIIQRWVSPQMWQSLLRKTPFLLSGHLLLKDPLSPTLSHVTSSADLLSTTHNYTIGGLKSNTAYSGTVEVYSSANHATVSWGAHTLSHLATRWASVSSVSNVLYILLFLFPYQHTQCTKLV